MKNYFILFLLPFQVFACEKCIQDLNARTDYIFERIYKEDCGNLENAYRIGLYSAYQSSKVIIWANHPDLDDMTDTVGYTDVIE